MMKVHRLKSTHRRLRHSILKLETPEIQMKGALMNHPVYTCNSACIIISNINKEGAREKRERKRARLYFSQHVLNKSELRRAI